MLRTIAICVSAAALALALAGGAEAQVGLRIDKIEQLGDWEKATVAGTALFVSAMPNSRLARAYCLSSYLNVPYEEIPNFGTETRAEAEAAKVGASQSYACLRLACDHHGSREIEVGLTANAPPNPSETGMPLGVSLRMRFAAGAAPLVLFERADAGQPSRDGALEMLDWRVSDRRDGADGPHAAVSLKFSAPLAFVEQLAAKPGVAFQLLSGQDRQMAAFKHGARTMEFGLARTAEVAAELRRLCARPRGN